MARITIKSPGGNQTKALLPRNTLGRHPNNTHQVLDRVVSKEHCHIDLIEGAYVLRDLGSLNGTFLNGTKVNRADLKDGDEIKVGSSTIIFEATTSTAHDASTDNLPTLAPEGRLDELVSRVTYLPELSVGKIHARVDALSPPSFLPEKRIGAEEALRGDYEKLRASYEVTRAIGVERDIDGLLNKILEVALRLLAADRGVVLLYDEQEMLQPRAVRTKRVQDAGEQVAISRTIVEAALADRAAVLSHDATADARFQSAESVIIQGIRSSMAVPLIHSDKVLGVLLLDSQLATHAFTEQDLHLLQTVASQAAVAIQNIVFTQQLEGEAITRERFQRLLSPAIAEQVIAGEVEVKKGGELRQATIFFSDIRDFTAMSESYAAQDIVAMLNEYFETMVEIIFKYEGTLDKLVGDEIMALFGAPVAHADDPVRAVQTALEMQQALKMFNQRRKSHGWPPAHVGIGINTGEVVAGYLGSSRALEYTVIGDAVNTGARLCSLATAGQILVSEFTAAHLQGRFHLEELPPAQVKGKTLPLRVFKVMGPMPGF